VCVVCASVRVCGVRVYWVCVCVCVVCAWAVPTQCPLTINPTSSEGCLAANASTVCVCIQVSLCFHGGGEEVQSGVYELLSSGRLHTSHMHHPACWNPLKNRGLVSDERVSMRKSVNIWVIAGLSGLFEPFL
jgi:hypothetical protein